MRGHHAQRHEMNPAYLKASFWCTQSLNRLPHTFGIITAWNPLGQVVPRKENRIRDARLHLQLKTLGLDFFSVCGGSLDGTHLEQGYGVLGTTRLDLATLGKDFDQDAIFWVSDGILALVCCQTAQSTPLGVLSKRWNPTHPGKYLEL